jgi:hypothetical protein
MELTAIADFPAKAAKSPLFAKLAEITAAHKGLWCAEAEKALLAYFDAKKKRGASAGKTQKKPAAKSKKRSSVK